MDVLTSNQLTEWMAYYSLNPSNEDRDDFRFAFMANMISNIATKVHGKPGAKLSEMKDFLPNWGKEEEEGPMKQGTDEMKTILLAFAASYNKELDKKKKMKRTTPPIKRRT